MNEHEQRVLTAAHEASHAAMARLVGVPITGPVSIRPAEHHFGLAFVGRPLRIPPSAYETVAVVPAPLWPAQVRRQTETRIMVVLAGRMGETLVLGPSSRFLDDTDDRAALELARPLMVELKPSDLPPHEARLLAVAEKGGPTATDQEDAYGLAMLVAHDDAEAYAFLAWMQRMTARTMYGARRFREQVESLMEELLTREVVASRRVRAILDAAYAGESSPPVAART
jgi:hypothetical protein